MYQPEFDSGKFRELMLYIADQSIDDPWFGAVKLNKILYFCDFQSFGSFYESITGATYAKLREGPVPRQLMRERQVLIDDDLATIEIKQVFRYTQQRLVPSQHGLEDRFTDDEKEVMGKF